MPRRCNTPSLYWRRTRDCPIAERARIARRGRQCPWAASPGPWAASPRL
jgi:hypothetical protein